jgi:SMI1 / KNR4 family (SUKH-1)
VSSDLALFGLDRIILRHAEKGRIDCPNGSIFICPLDGGALRFLHKIFGGRRNSSNGLETLFGFSLPDDYVEFMTRFNGATLFDNSFSIYGIADLNRGLRLEDQQPISLSAALDERRSLYGPAVTWLPVASVSGYNELFHLELSGAGEARIGSDGQQTKRLGSFREIVCDITNLLSLLSDDRGFFDKSRRRVDAEISRFASPI